MMRTAVFRLWGHRSGGPRELRDQSISRIRVPISPPPARKVALAWLVEAVLGVGLIRGGR